MDDGAQIRRAVVLGLVQGPAELLPVSSSAHISLLPWLLGWDRNGTGGPAHGPVDDGAGAATGRDGGVADQGLDAEMRKTFEIALHAGAAAALLIGQRRLLADELRGLDRRNASVLICSFLPAAVVGYRFERLIEERLCGPRAIAAGLVAGSVAMAATDRRPGKPARPPARPLACLPASRRLWPRRLWPRRRSKAWAPNALYARTSRLPVPGARGGSIATRGRGRGEADWRDGLALGLAQAAALAPGVSRNGATLAAARRRGFSRDQANLLSRVVALPIITGATALKAARLRRRGIEPGHTAILATGTAASFVSTLASQRLIGLVERDRALWPYAAYRLTLAAAILLKSRRAP